MPFPLFFSEPNYMNTRLLDAFFYLLRAGLWADDESPLVGNLRLSDSEWAEIHRIAREQSVTALVLDGVLRLDEAQLPSRMLLLRWTAELDAIENINLRMNEAIAALSRLFKRHGLHPVLLKGQGVAANYARPEIRECGDIDLYFSHEGEQLEAEHIMRNNGISFEHDAECSTHFLWKGFTVELHTALYDMKAYCARRALSNPLWRKLQPFAVEGAEEEIDVPQAEACLALLSTHVLKHVLGRGIGLRQFCDLARTYRAFHSPQHLEALRKLYSEMHLTQWSTLLHAFLHERLGVPYEEMPAQQPASPPNTDALLAIVLRGGNFGHYAKGKVNERSRYALVRKASTLLCFAKNVPFALHYAPREAIATFCALLRGQHIWVAL